MDTEIIWCKGCGIEISWSAIIKNGNVYCCEDCSNGEPCSCSYSVELDTDLYKPQYINQGLY